MTNLPAASTVPNPTPTPSTPRLRRDWVERLIDLIQRKWTPAKFAAQWEGINAESLIVAWQEELAGLAREELTDGVSKMQRLTDEWPPTPAKFIALCRPWMDPGEALRIAMTEIVEREKGRDKWPHPAVYWAAIQVGHFEMMRKPHEALLSSYTRAFNECLANPNLPPVPAREAREALPPPTKATPDSPAFQRFKEDMAALKAKGPSQAALRARAAGFKHPGDL